MRIIFGQIRPLKHKKEGSQQTASTQLLTDRWQFGNSPVSGSACWNYSLFTVWPSITLHTSQNNSYRAVVFHIKDLLQNVVCCFCWTWQWEWKGSTGHTQLKLGLHKNSLCFILENQAEIIEINGSCAKVVLLERGCHQERPPVLPCSPYLLTPPTHKHLEKTRK